MTTSTVSENKEHIYFSQSISGISNNGSYAIGTALANDRHGNVYVAGIFAGTLTLGNLSLISVGAQDIFVAKLDPTLEWVMATNAGGNGTTAYSTSLTTDGFGNVYITGNYQGGPLTFGTLPQLPSPASTFYNVFVAKLNTSFAWTQTTSAGGTDGTNRSAQIISDADNLYITGYCSGSCTFESLNVRLTPGQFYTFVAQLNPDLAWIALTTGGQGSRATGILLDSCDNLFIVGSFASTATFGNTTLISALVSNMYVAKLDSSLNWIDAIAPTCGTDTSASIYPGALGITGDSSGNIYVCGTFLGTIIFKSFFIDAINNIKLSTNGFVVKLDSHLNWIKASTIAQSECASVINNLALASDYSGNIYVTGIYTKGLLFDDIRLNSFGSSYNLFVAKADSYLNWIGAVNGGGSGVNSAINTALNITDLGLVTDCAGNIYVTSGFQGTVHFGKNILNSINKEIETVFIAQVMTHFNQTI